MKISTYEDKGVVCAQYFLLFFDLALWVIGGVMLGFGIFFHVSKDVYATLTSETYYIGANLLIAGGVMLIVGGFVGCCSALWDNQLALLGFIFYLLITLGLEIATAIVGYDGVPKLESIAKKHMTDDVQHKFNKIPDVTSALNRLQSTRHCCGVDSYQDWSTSAWAANRTVEGHRGLFPVPPSCCNVTVTGHNNENCKLLYDNGKHTKYIYVEGCYPKYKDDIVMFMYSVAAFGIGVSLFQVTGIMLALVMCCSLSGTQGYKYL